MFKSKNRELTLLISTLTVEFSVTTSLYEYPVMLVIKILQWIKNQKNYLYFFNDIFRRFFLTLEQNVLYLIILVFNDFMILN